MTLTAGHVRFTSSALIGLALLLLVGNFAGQHGGVTPFGPDLGGDYTASYRAGWILNTEPDRLYDLAIQESLYRRIVPDAPKDRFLPYSYAPFLAVLFRPLALLPYEWSYLVWLLIGVILAWTGFWMLWRAKAELTGGDRPTAMLASLSFTPLLIEGWIGGQNSVLAVFLVAAAAFLHARGRKTAAGMALACLSFKPTLLILLAPMLIATRSFRVLGGLALGGLVLLGVSIWAVGLEGCGQFVRHLAVYSEIKRSAVEILPFSKYVDVRWAARPLFGQATAWSNALLFVFIAASSAVLLRTWLRKPDWRIAWASALAWTPVLNMHCAIYDASLLVPAALLAATKQNLAGRWFPTLLTLVYLAAWCTQPIAAATGFQILSAAIVLLGLYLCLCKDGAERTRLPAA